MKNETSHAKTEKLTDEKSFEKPHTATSHDHGVALQRQTRSRNTKSDKRTTLVMLERLRFIDLGASSNDDRIMSTRRRNFLINSEDYEGDFDAIDVKTMAVNRTQKLLFPIHKL